MTQLHQGILEGVPDPIAFLPIQIMFPKIVKKLRRYIMFAECKYMQVGLCMEILKKNIINYRLRNIFSRNMD